MAAPVCVLFVMPTKLSERLQRAIQQAHEACVALQADTLKEAREALEGQAVDCVVAAQTLPDGLGTELLAWVRDRDEELPFILLAERADRETARTVVELGGTDYLPTLLEDGEPELLLERVSELVLRRRAERRAEETEQVDRLIREIDRMLVQASDEAEILERTVEILASAEPYVFAWIGRVDERVDIVRPVTAAGIDESYLNEIVVTTREEPTGEGPTGRTVRTGEIQTMQDILNDPDYEPWREQALERGFRSSAAVPLAHEGELFAVLNVYSDRPFAFHERERQLLEDVAGTISFAIASARTRERIEGRNRALTEQQRYTQQLLDSFPDGVYVLEADGSLKQWNEAIERVTGYSSAELAGKEVTAFFPEDDQERLQGALAATLEEGTQRFEADIVTADGDRIPYEFVSAAMRDPSGEAIIAGIARDIEERKEREARVERQRDQLEILNRLVRHDIKNDMMVVVGLAEVLYKRVPEEHEEDLVRILETGKHTLEMTKVARDLVELIRRGGALEVEPTSLSEALEREVLNAERSFPEATFEAGSLPDVDVQANQLLGAVFRNILNNAVQHNDKETPEIQVEAEVVDGSVTVRIADNGPGIPDDRKAKLFERAGQGLSSAEESIGLYLVATLVDHFGGTIRVEDHQPAGTVFEVELSVA